jgi:1-acyl-sn-glycerol-3-phosphate acyltransferase
MGELGRVRTFLLRVAFGAVTVVLGSLAVVVGLIAPRRAVRVAHLWGRACLSLAGVPVFVEGLDNIVAGDRYVIMANHESGLDIPVLLTALPSFLELRFLAKKSLFGVPFLGWAMRSAGFVPVDRDDRSTAVAMLAQTLDEVRRGASPLVFPEETWTVDGRLLPFQRGGFLVALRTGLPILPVGLEGTRLVLPPDQGVIQPQPVTVRIGPPIPTAGLGVSQRSRLTTITRREIDRLRGPLGHIGDEALSPGLDRHPRR